jgi:hypothetical protein
MPVNPNIPLIDNVPQLCLRLIELSQLIHRIGFVKTSQVCVGSPHNADFQYSAWEEPEGRANVAIVASATTRRGRRKKCMKNPTGNIPADAYF